MTATQWISQRLLQLVLVLTVTNKFLIWSIHNEILFMLQSVDDNAVKKTFMTG